MRSRRHRRRTPVGVDKRPDPETARRPAHRDLHVPEAEETDLQLGYRMTVNLGFSEAEAARLSDSARDHLWMHFTRLSSYEKSAVPTIVRGEGAYIYDIQGRCYLDGLSGLFTVQVGH